MSDSFMVAARIPMSREAFDRWLTAPIPGLPVIANPAEMFDGWFWDGRRLSGDEWPVVEPDLTPRRFLADRVAATCDGRPEMTVASYRDGALETYLFHLGYDRWSVHTALLMLAGAGAHKAEAAEDTVLFWAETSGGLWNPKDAGWLAVLSVGRDGSRFVAERELEAPVTALRPAEGRYFDLVENLADHEETTTTDSTPIPRDPAFVDPAVLA